MKAKKEAYVDAETELLILEYQKTPNPDSKTLKYLSFGEEKTGEKTEEKR